MKNPCKNISYSKIKTSKKYIYKNLNLNFKKRKKKKQKLLLT